MEERKDGGSASLVERESTVNTSAEVVPIGINDQDPKWRLTVSKNAEIRMVRATKSEAKICIGTTDEACPKESWHGILRQN